MNDIIFQLHTPEEFRFLSNVGHWIAGYLFLAVAVIAFLQARNLFSLRSYPFLWSLLIVIAGFMFIPYTLAHHGINELPFVWQVIQVDPQQRQHFSMFTLLFIAGIVELFLSIKRLRGVGWYSIWPAVLLSIGYMFLNHPQHGTLEAQAYSKPYHTTLGILLVFTGVAKVTQIYWSKKYTILTYLWIFFMGLSSILLILYNEPIGSYESEPIQQNDSGSMPSMNKH